MKQFDRLRNLSPRESSPGFSTEDAEYFELEQFDDPKGLNKTKHIKMAEEEELYISDFEVVNRVLNFLRGPETPEDDPPNFNRGILGSFERFPVLFSRKYTSLKRTVLLGAYLSVWLTIIYIIMSPVFKEGAVISNEGTEYEVLTMSCTGSGHFWEGKNQHCGIQGELCIPDKKEVIIKCPALCDRGWTYSSTPVGDEMVKYRQYTIGGGAIPKKERKDYDLSFPYRGDSFPCSSAVHAGAVSPFLGGCVRMKFDGAKLSFDAKSGAHGTGLSINFDSFFPSSFVFQKFTHATSIQGCYDPRLIVLLFNFLLGAPFMFMASGKVAFWVLSFVGFWTVIMTLDPPIVADAQEPSSVATLFSIGFERLLPLFFVLYVIWTTTVKRTLSGPSSPIGKTFLWYPLFWIGIANNITFDRLPVDRLTPKDIREMPGSFLTIVFILVTVVICTIFQGYQIWKSGRLITYLRFYGLIILGIIALAMLPGLGLRIHHYILGMLLIAGTSTRGSSALVLQGVLLGLVISGIARWDFASIVESNISLMRGEAGSSTEPPLNFHFENGNVSWTPTAIGTDVNLHGYSLIINDVEAYVGNSTSLSIGDLISADKHLREMVNLALSIHDEVPLYLRLAKSSTEPGSMDRGDYTRAAILTWPKSNWTDPVPGVS